MQQTFSIKLHEKAALQHCGQAENKKAMTRGDRLKQLIGQKRDQQASSEPTGDLFYRLDCDEAFVDEDVLSGLGALQKVLPKKEGGSHQSQPCYWGANMHQVGATSLATPDSSRRRDRRHRLSR
jgi:hypothetical protein